MNEVFVFAQTRSGSTLLQRAINQTPGMMLYGEHGGMLHGFAAAYYGADFPCLEQHSRNKPEVLRDLNAFAPCQSCIEANALRDNMRYFIENTFNPNHSPRWGFKEVRYGRHTRYESDRVFKMLVELFPTAKFVLLVRDPRDQIQSAVSMNWVQPDQGIEEWRKQFEFYCALRRDHPDRCRIYEYPQLEDATRIFDWLQLDCPYAALFSQLPVTGATPSKGMDILAHEKIKAFLLPLYLHQPFD